jgi:hypothetical protein
LYGEGITSKMRTNHALWETASDHRTLVRELPSRTHGRVHADTCEMTRPWRTVRGPLVAHTGRSVRASPPAEKATKNQRASDC